MHSEDSESEGYGRQRLEDMGLTPPKGAEPKGAGAVPEGAQQARSEKAEQEPGEGSLAVKVPSTQARAALIVAILAIPAALVPILGLLLGVVAIVLGARARKEPVGRPTGRAKAAIVVGAVAILVALASFAFTVSRQGDKKDGARAPSMRMA